jgi:hydrogenase/urease accessory protein HupE
LVCTLHHALAVFFAWCVMLSTATAHIMVAQNGTLNIVENRGYLVVSLPATAFPSADDDADGMLSRAEFARHYAELERIVLTGVHLDGATLMGIMLQLSPPDESPMGPAPQLIAIGVAVWPHAVASPRISVSLFGTHTAERIQTITVTRGSERAVAVLTPTRQAQAVFASWQDTARDFFKIGLEHILDGVDHLLFLVVLLLAGGTLRRYLIVLTAFTLAHTATCTFSLLGWLVATSHVVEPLIAASIVLMAALSLSRATSGERPRHSTWHEVALVFALGLLHGLGFASGLMNVNLSSQERLPAIVGFNVGIEAGQLMVVSIGLGLLWCLRRTMRSTHHRIVTRGLLASAVVVSSVWFAARLVDG